MCKGKPSLAILVGVVQFIKLRILVIITNDRAKQLNATNAVSNISIINRNMALSSQSLLSVFIL